jgi:hypothetical protein
MFSLGSGPRRGHVRPDPPEHHDVIGDDDRHQERDEQAERQSE